LGTEHQEHYFTAKDALKIIPQLCKIYDEPFAEYAATPTVLTAELLKEAQIEHIFVGDGGDEVFATADDTHFFERIHAIPYELRALLTYPLKKLLLEKIPYLKDFHNLPTKYSKLLQILSSKNIPTTIEARNILFRENELQQLVQNYSIPITTTFNEINFNGYHETVDEIIGTYFKTTMTDGELVKSYGAMNQYDIRLHTPFLDEELIAYMATVPSSIKIKEGIKKNILKEIGNQNIPKHLLDRPKSGFEIPF
jgi:asparagine synthase (glutamine-hydrolysing)